MERGLFKQNSGGSEGFPEEFWEDLRGFLRNYFRSGRVHFGTLTEGRVRLICQDFTVQQALAREKRLTVQCHYDHDICVADLWSNVAALKTLSHPPSKRTHNHPHILQNIYGGKDWCGQHSVQRQEEEEEDKWKKKLSTEEDARERQGQSRNKEIQRHAHRHQRYG